LFAVVAAGNELAHPRLGMAVGIKAAGNAVSRNRIRRAIRETFRQLQHQLPAVDIVVNARPGSKTADRSALLYSLETLFAKVTRQS
jgi:ribonuclease P protein component